MEPTLDKVIPGANIVEGRKVPIFYNGGLRIPVATAREYGVHTFKGPYTLTRSSYQEACRRWREASPEDLPAMVAAGAAGFAAPRSEWADVVLGLAARILLRS